MNESHTPRTEPKIDRYRPGLRTRLLWWFCVYLVAQIPVLLQVPTLEFFFSYPCSLSAFLYFNVPGLRDHLPEVMHIPFQLLGFAVFFVHLVASLSVRSSKTFFVLLVGLVALVSLTTAGALELIAAFGCV